MRRDDIDIACVSESHLTNNINLPTPPDYHVIRKDRDGHLGGLVTLIKHEVKYTQVNLRPTVILEHDAFIIENDHPFLLINSYLPGGSKLQDIKNNLESDLISLTSYQTPNFIVGDLNARHSTWNKGRNNAAGKILFNFAQSHNLTVDHPRDPSYCPASAKKNPSTIDLLLTNSKLGHSIPFTKLIFTSDHIPVFCTIDSSRIMKTKSKNIQKLVPNYSKANWRQLRNKLEKLLDPIYNKLTSTNTMTDTLIDGTIDELTRSIQYCANSEIPKTRLNKYGCYHTDEIRQIIKTRNYYRKRWTGHRIESDRALYLTNHRMAQSLIKELHKVKLENELKDCKNGDKRIFKIIKRRKTNNIIPPLDDNGVRLVNSKDKANLLGSHFFNMHRNTLARSNLLFDTIVKTQISSYKSNTKCRSTNIDIIPEEETLNIIRTLKTGAAMGADKIPIVLIKNLPPKGIRLITAILNQCLTLGYFSRSWRSAITIPIAKPGKDPTNKTSYRPISLLYGLSKIFRPKHSTGHALTHLYYNIKQGLNNRLTTGVIAFDIEKAFDRLWHEGLTYKKIKNNFPIYLIDIIDSFISNRDFTVKIDSSSSPTLNIPWGLPQGSVLSRPYITYTFMIFQKLSLSSLSFSFYMLMTR